MTKVTTRNSIYFVENNKVVNIETEPWRSVHDLILKVPEITAQFVVGGSLIGNGWYTSTILSVEEVRPKIVCLCGSTRFMEAFQDANLRETLDGHIVLSVGCNTKSDGEIGLGADVKIALDELHKRKIDLADEILVLNVGGYIGESTRSEIDYAVRFNKPVRYLETPSI